MGVKDNLDVSVVQKKIVLDLLKRYIPDTEVWAYGSRVTGMAKTYSDLDMVAFSSKEQENQIFDLKEAFEESDLPFRVDLFVWDKIPCRFHENIKSRHVVLQKSS